MVCKFSPYIYMVFTLEFGKEKQTHLLLCTYQMHVELV